MAKANGNGEKVKSMESWIWGMPPVASVGLPMQQNSSLVFNFFKAISLIAEHTVPVELVKFNTFYFY